MMLLSYYYGAEMSFLMNDSRIEEALKVGFEREKQIERLKAVPQISEDYIDGQYSYLYAKLAYIYCMEKKYEKAEQYYQKYVILPDREPGVRLPHHRARARPGICIRPKLQNLSKATCFVLWLPAV